MDYLPESFLIELGEGPNDSISPVNGGEVDDKPNPFNSVDGRRELKAGDPVAVKNMRYEGSTGKIIDTDGQVATVEFDYNAGKHKFNVADLEFNDYSNDPDNNDGDHELENLRRLAGYQ